MNCPVCGSETLSKQQYCRSCGTELFVDRPPSSRPQVLGLLILATTFGGLLISMAGKLAELRWLTFTGVFVMVIGIFLMAAFGMMRELRPRKRREAHFQKPEPVLRADTTNKLLPIPDNDFIPSVVEGTTNLLKTPEPSRSKNR